MKLFKTTVFRKVACWLFWFGFLFCPSLYAQQNIINHGNMEGTTLTWTINYNVTTTDYTYLSAPYTGSTLPGQSTVYHEPDVFNTAFIPIDDMTEGGGGTLLVDGSTVPHQYFWKGGHDGNGFCGLTPGITYTFTYYIRSTTALVTGPATQADVRIDFTNASNITLLTGSTVAPLPADGWLKVSYSFEATADCVDINLWNFNTNAVGNDFALDEFSLLREQWPFTVTYSLSQSTCEGGISLYCYATGGNQNTISVALVGPSYSNTVGPFHNLGPGNYTLTVTDADGTVVSQPVTIDPYVSQLTISPDVNICDGDTTTLQVSGSTTNYYWSSSPYDSDLITSSTPIITVSPSVTTTYKAVSIDNTPTGNLIYNGDFSMGNVGFTSGHYYYPTNFENAPGAYGIVNNAAVWSSTAACGDHTSGTGNMLVANGINRGYDGGGHPFWEQVVPVNSSTNYILSFWIKSLSGVQPANITVIINGSIQNITPFPAPSTTGCNDWVQYSLNYYSAGFLTEAAWISINNLTTYFEGNEFAIDDIVFEAAQKCLSNEVTVTVAPPATVALTASSTVSSTVAFDWDALPSVTGYNISYTVNSGTPISGGTLTGTDYTVNGLNPGDAVTITVVPIDAGCFGPASLMKNSFSPCEIPVASITQQPTCTDPTGTITVSTPLGTEFEYSLDGTTFQASPIFNNLASDTYTVILRNNLMGCLGTGNTLTFSNTGLQQPDVTAVQTIVDCEVVLTASSTTPNTSLVWNGPTLAPDTANPATTFSGGTYTATATNLLTGCTQDYIITVLPLDIPAVATVTAVLPTCTNASGSIRVSAPLNPNYEYSIDGSTYQSGQDFLNLAPGIFPVTVRNTLTGCLSSPFMADLSLPLITQPPVALFPAVAFCQNAIATPLVATPMPGATVNWYGQNATGGTPSSVAPIPDTTVLGNFVFYCSQSIGFCESARIAILVSVYVDALAPDFDDIEVCQGAVAPVLPTVSPNGIPGSWSPNVVSTAASGSYTFTPEPTACASEQTITITIVQPPILSFEWFVDTDFSDGQTVTVVPAVPGNYLYQLDGGVPQSSPVFNNVAPGIHSITMLDAEGCSKPVTQNDVVVVGYPRYFTPNGDSYNDTWSIEALFHEHDAKVDIFDRYGKLLKRLNLKNAEVWDGTHNGQLLPATDYWFTLHYNNLGVQKEFSSHFSLKR